jgi:hypothetical protein
MILGRRALLANIAACSAAKTLMGEHMLFLFSFLIGG